MAHIVTVRGNVAPDEIGPVMAHEHLFLDASEFFDPSNLPNPADGELPFEARFGGLARWEGGLFRDNLVLHPERDYELIRSEVQQFADATEHGCLVDLTTLGLHTDHTKVRQISEDTGVHVVAGAGIYVHAMHPAWVESASTDDLTAWLLGEVRNGFGSTEIRPGIIGEIGTSEELHDCEERVLRASARVARTTGLAINIHCHPSTLDVTTQILDVLEEEGHPMTRTYLSHLDEIWDLDYHAAVLDRGVVVGFDSYGQDGYFSPTWKSLSDATKMATMAALISGGYRDQLVVAQDVCKKHFLQRFGGFGYDHVVRRVIPRLRDVHGIDDDTVQQLLVETPRRLLTIDQ